MTGGSPFHSRAARRTCSATGRDATLGVTRGTCTAAGRIATPGMTRAASSQAGRVAPPRVDGADPPPHCRQCHRCRLTRRVWSTEKSTASLGGTRRICRAAAGHLSTKGVTTRGPAPTWAHRHSRGDDWSTPYRTDPRPTVGRGNLPNRRPPSGPHVDASSTVRR